MKSLLDPITLGDIECRNRVAMAPCTRCKSPDHLPTEEVAAYYGRRAADGVGLLISEGTVIAARADGYPGAPGIWSAEQVEAWRPVTDRVHEAGGRIACQIWHVGAVAHPLTTGGELPEGPSGVSPEGEIKRLRRPDGSHETYGESEAMSEERIIEVIDLYRRAAANSIAAGFDGVEIHGAHSYLIDQFVNLSFNLREDGWGGEHRCRFGYEVAKAVVGEIGAGRTIYRFSPSMSVTGMGWKKPAETLPLLLRTLWEAGIRVLHASNMLYDEPVVPIEALAANDRDGLAPDGEGRIPLHAAARRLWQGQLIGVGGLTPARAEAAIAAKEIDVAAFGRALIANPDFVGRVREGRELEEYDPAKLEILF